MNFIDIVRTGSGLLTGDPSAQLAAAGLVKSTQGKINSSLEKTGGDLAKIVGAGLFKGLTKGAQVAENSQLEKTVAQISVATPAEYKLGALAILAGALYLVFRE